MADKPVKRIEVEKGIPIFDGDVELLDEYKIRAMDVYFARHGTPRQLTTAIDLRGGTRGVAWDAVKDIPHAQLMTSEPGQSRDAVIAGTPSLPPGRPGSPRLARW